MLLLLLSIFFRYGVCCDWHTGALLYISFFVSSLLLSSSLKIFVALCIENMAIHAQYVFTLPYSVCVSMSVCVNVGDENVYKYIDTVILFIHSHTNHYTSVEIDGFLFRSYFCTACLCNTHLKPNRIELKCCSLFYAQLCMYSKWSLKTDFSIKVNSHNRCHQSRYID